MTNDIRRFFRRQALKALWRDLSVIAGAGGIMLWLYLLHVLATT